MASTLGFSYETLMDMEFSELLVTWFPQASSIFRKTESEKVRALLRGLFGGR